MSAEDADIPKLTGIRKYVNSYTTQGRANAVILVYSSLGLGYIIYKIKNRKSE